MDERDFNDILQSSSRTPAVTKRSAYCCGVCDKILQSYSFNFFFKNKFDAYFVSNLLWNFVKLQE